MRIWQGLVQYSDSRLSYATSKQTTQINYISHLLTQSSNKLFNYNSIKKKNKTRTVTCTQTKNTINRPLSVSQQSTANKSQKIEPKYSSRIKRKLRYSHYKEISIRQAFLPVVWDLEKPWSIEPPSDTHIRQRAERCLSEGNTMVYRNQNVVQHAETTTPQFYELLLQRVFNNTRLRKRCC